ncbi:hypothetical protein ACWGVR_29115 [Streptomyces xanthophaeus]
MTTPPPAITLTLTYYKCRFGRRELDALFATAAQGFAPDELSFSHERHSRTFTANCLDDLIAAVCAAPLPGDPDEWTNLTFKATDPTGRRTVTLSLRRGSVDCEVTGTDATLVYGADAQIRLFIEDVSIGGVPPIETSSIKKQFAWACALTFFVGNSLWTTLMVSALTPGMQVHDYAVIILGALLCLIFLGATGRLAIQRRADRPVLEVVHELPTGTSWQRLQPIEKLTAYAVAVAAIAAVGTLVSAGTDVFK